MALFAEELVEEWLNRKGYFNIGGMKLGVNKSELLAVKFDKQQLIECRHIEVQASNWIHITHAKIFIET